MSLENLLYIFMQDVIRFFFVIIELELRAMVFQEYLNSGSYDFLVHISTYCRCKKRQKFQMHITYVGIMYKTNQLELSKNNNMTTKYVKRDQSPIYKKGHMS